MYKGKGINKNVTEMIQCIRECVCVCVFEKELHLD